LSGMARLTAAEKQCL